MDGLRPNDPVAQMRKTLTLVGCAMMASVGVYVFLAWIMTKSPSRTVPDVWESLQYPLMAAAACAVVVGVVMEKKLRARGSRGAATGDALTATGTEGTASLVPPEFTHCQTAFIVSLAMFESVAIFGLVLFFLGMSFERFLYWAGAAVLLQATLAMPKIGQYAREAEQAMARGLLDTGAAASPDDE